LDGKVWLVGAGPGDPGLLTVKGSRTLAVADVVVFDRLVNPAILELTHPGCERVDAGKQPGRATLTQSQINDLLVDRARAGQAVVRLKGGDPFVFGRGGEEAEACQRAGVAFEVVSGVSSAIAAPAYAGIPLTHRGVAASFCVITGHEDPQKADAQVDWSRLAHSADTLVCLMGVQSLPATVDRLLKAGKPADTPAAVISWGTLNQQRTVTGTLSDLPAKARAAGVEAPAVAIFGDVVKLREQLNWFETRPLFGKRILVTRTRQQASELRSRFEEEGAEVIELATLEIVDGASPQLLTQVTSALAAGEYAWVVFTSVNGVRRFMEALRENALDARAFRDCGIAVVGPGTARVLMEFGLRADAMPAEYDGSHLAALFGKQDLTRRRVLVPRADIARPELVTSLRAQGAEVEEVPLYRSELPRHPDPAVLARIGAGELDVVTFASSSAARNLVKMLGDRVSGLHNALVACIGPNTAHTAERCGLRVGAVASEQTIPALVEAVRSHFVGQQAGRERPSGGSA
jgi:uroporphyrinogen III methyltransferase / synthase